MSYIQAPLTQEQIRILLVALLETLYTEKPEHDFRILIYGRSTSRGDNIFRIFYKASDKVFISNNYWPSDNHWSSKSTCRIIEAITAIHITEIQLIYNDKLVYNQSPVRQVKCKGIYGVSIYTYIDSPPTIELKNNTAITTSITGVILGIVPIFYDEVPIRHGPEGLWYIRSDDKPLTYQYWLRNKLVSKKDYNTYIELSKQEVQKQSIFIVDLTQIICSYIG